MSLLHTSPQAALRAQQERAAASASEPADYYAVARNPAAAPEYDVDVRRGRSSGVAAPVVLTLEDVELMRKKRADAKRKGLEWEPPPEVAEALAAAAAAAAPPSRGAGARAEGGSEEMDDTDELDATGGCRPHAGSSDGAARGSAGDDGAAAGAKRARGPGRPRAPRPPRKRPAAELQEGAAPRVRPPAAPAPWQLIAAGGASRGGSLGGSEVGSGRPRRAAAAGVAAAVAAAAAAAAGGEGSFLDMAAQLQAEQRGSSAAWAAPQQPQRSHLAAIPATMNSDGNSLPPRNHVHDYNSSTTAADLAAGAAPPLQPQQQQQQGAAELASTLSAPHILTSQPATHNQVLQEVPQQQDKEQKEQEPLHGSDAPADAQLFAAAVPAKEETLASGPLPLADEQQQQQQHEQLPPPPTVVMASEQPGTTAMPGAPPISPSFPAQPVLPVLPVLPVPPVLHHQEGVEALHAVAPLSDAALLQHPVPNPAPPPPSEQHHTCWPVLPLPHDAA